jgi:hypothetical protein
LVCFLFSRPNCGSASIFLQAILPAALGQKNDNSSHAPLLTVPPNLL